MRAGCRGRGKGQGEGGRRNVFTTGLCGRAFYAAPRPCLLPSCPPMSPITASPCRLSSPAAATALPAPLSLPSAGPPLPPLQPQQQQQLPSQPGGAPSSQLPYAAAAARSSGAARTPGTAERSGRRQQQQQQQQQGEGSAPPPLSSPWQQQQGSGGGGSGKPFPPPLFSSALMRPVLVRALQTSQPGLWQRLWCRCVQNPHTDTHCTCTPQFSRPPPQPQATLSLISPRRCSRAGVDPLSSSL